MASIPSRQDTRNDRCVQTAVAIWTLIGVVVGLMGNRILSHGFPGGALGAAFGGGAGGFLGGAVFTVLIGADGSLGAVALAAAAAGAAALVATIQAAGRGSVRGR
jgi:uncharacterized membrane protein YeaQ/YmgE (transglycosylase-associated protein family)